MSSGLAWYFTALWNTYPYSWRLEWHFLAWRQLVGRGYMAAESGLLFLDTQIGGDGGLQN
jgi:hypothetical protein